MKNFVSRGRTLTVTAPYNRNPGEGVKIGSIFGVASAAALSGAELVIATTGVFDLLKAASQAWTVGAKIYWDDTAKVCTTTASTNILIGTAVAAVADGVGDTIGRVRLNGSFTI